jgi:hypothetical protein
VASTAASKDSPFTFDGDVAMRMTKDSNALSSAAIHNAVVEYHLSYRDSAGIVIAELSAPTSARRGMLPAGTVSLLNWKKIRHIRLRSDATQAEILLTNGHSVLDDRTALVAGVPLGSGVAKPDASQIASPEQRLTGLRSMIAPFVRRAPDMTIISRPKAPNAPVSDSSVWIRSADGVEVATFRRRKADAAARGTAPRIETTLEVRNARVTGHPNLIP